MRWFFRSVIAAALTLAACAESVDWSAVVQRNASAVVVTYAEKDESTAQGSGVCIGASGFVLTTAHQVDGARRIMGRRQTGESFDLRLVDKDPKLDIALLQSSEPLGQCVVIGNAQALPLGAALLGITSPKNLEFSATDGILSARRLFRGNEILQTTIPFAEGSSGGPVFDQEGLLVGFVYGQVADFSGATLVYPINNAYALLRNHEFDVPERSIQIQQPGSELIQPVAGLSRNERSAIDYFNAGVKAASPSEK
ncbi:MAG: trypsin-like peptidase domain-containing protein, partial [Candidatus Hydrogenedentes bacterium]|nr:trypsin-like peptidase domain-containing protein [Candidatus Hydrogenedentota bacterium]